MRAAEVARNDLATARGGFAAGVTQDAVASAIFGLEEIERLVVASATPVNKRLAHLTALAFTDRTSSPGLEGGQLGAFAVLARRHTLKILA